ncbi:MAG: hypothetical protein CVV44_08955 [Spirochaetae bacterium HGW-Spirochaetae-1]|nr:MAG: hypothetical protein CVV44_08955 [Spirochaetae bacterium HGW-Spirochaetae-1]
MKRLSILIIIVTLALPAFAVDREFVGKLGTSYAHDLESFGFDLSANYLFDIDPWFVAGFEADFFWIPWEKKLGTKDGTPPKEVVATTNTFAFPFFCNAQVRLPFLVDKIYVEPYITVGIGYSLMFLTYHRPHFEDTDGTTYNKKNVFGFYHGFTWQFLPGVSFKPSPKSNIKFVAELGYRGLSPGNADEKIVMSGLLMRVGVLLQM